MYGKIEIKYQDENKFHKRNYSSFIGIFLTKHLREKHQSYINSFKIYRRIKYFTIYFIKPD